MTNEKSPTKGHNDTSTTRGPQRGEHKGLPAKVATLEGKVHAAKRRKPIAEATLSPRQEAFCQSIAKGMSGAQACRESGYSDAGDAARAQASRLLSKVAIRTRIAELTMPKADAARMTRDAYIEDSKDLENLARARGNLVSLARAIELRGKVLGFFIERTEQVDMVSKARHLPADEQLRLLRASLIKMMADPEMARAVREAVAEFDAAHGAMIEGKTDAQH